MTKLSSFRRNGKKVSKRQRNGKLYVFEFDDVTDEVTELGRTFKSRIPSKQQYKRLKNKYVIQNVSEKNQSKKNKLTNENQTTIQPNEKTLILQPKKSIDSSYSSLTPPLSAHSFHIQPDWSDFEDSDHIHFDSEIKVDLSKYFQLLDDKEMAEFGAYDDVCLGNDQQDNNLSGWATELSLHRFDHALSTICFLEDIVKSNYTSIFNLNFKPTIWCDSLADANGLLIFCESNKCLFQDLMTKEYSINLQDNCLKWTELSTRCSILKSCLEKIVNFHEGKCNLDTALCVLHEQCLSILDHGMIYPDPLVLRIIDGIKKILQSLKTQFNRIKVILEDHFDLSNKCYTTALDQVDQEIIKLELEENVNQQLKAVVESLRMYLGKETKWIQEPVLNFCF